MLENCVFVTCSLIRVYVKGKDNKQCQLTTKKTMFQQKIDEKRILPTFIL